jgi:hypothetical protein
LNAKEAKDFLVEQTAHQAALQGIALSELEKRMMYFTEQDDSCENPIQLNEEFEAQYDTPTYEAKIAGLMRNATRGSKRRILRRSSAGIRQSENCPKETITFSFYGACLRPASIQGAMRFFK